ncbi:hypothetical protein [Streptomyces tsukubensis]|uniref:hypothetical protein n=1 Tax=Streptomyces tsukubensis TaxID=83656 RepID=UPI001D044A92|nr:hypothetical protein [Streptomyces tsukubensis]
MRTATAAATLAFAGVSLAGATAAVAAPGDSGDIAVHKTGMAPSDTRDEKEVCKFTLSARNFETAKAATWTVTPQPKSPDKPVLTGELPLVNGAGHTPDYSLPNGTYELSWTIPGGVPKKKTFRINCSIGERDDNKKPSGAVAAGGGGMSNAAASGTDDSWGVGGPLLVTAAVSTAGVVLVRRARRRGHDAA